MAPRKEANLEEVNPVEPHQATDGHQTAEQFPAPTQQDTDDHCEREEQAQGQFLRRETPKPEALANHEGKQQANHGEAEDAGGPAKDRRRDFKGI